jgi:hypothetical protein
MVYIGIYGIYGIYGDIHTKKKTGLYLNTLNVLAIFMPAISATAKVRCLICPETIDTYLHDLRTCCGMFP